MKTSLLFAQIFILSLLTFTTSFSQEYCEPYFTSAVGTDKFTGITNVKLNSTPAIDNSSEYNDWYVYFDKVEAGGLKAGEEYELVVKVKWNINSNFFTNKVQIYAWVDWNQNYTFDEGEEIAEIDQTEIIPYSEERGIKIMFTVPQDAKSGITRLRISEDMDQAGGHRKQTACGYPENDGLGQHGNVEDYDLQIITGEAKPKITLSINSIDFGDVEIASSSSKTITIENNGNADLTIESMIIEGEQSGVFSISQDVTFPMVISAGSTSDVSISANPSGESSFNANLIITSNDPDNSKINVPLSVVGTVEPAKISISSDLLDFGEVEIDTKEVLGGIEITNTGGEDLLINSMYVASNQATFVLINPEDSEALEESDFPIIITNAGDDKFELMVEFAPSDVKGYTSKVLLETNILGDYYIDVKGNGYTFKSILDDKNANLNISVSPNPIKGENADISVDLHGEGREIEMFVVDLNGNIVVRIESDNLSFGENNLVLNTTGLSSGSYFLISNYMGVKYQTSIIIAK